MEVSFWPPSHCEALREFLNGGMTYGNAVHALNARFGTVYSRSAALGRARRMGLPVTTPQESRPCTDGEHLRRVVRPQYEDFILLKLLRSKLSLPRLAIGHLRCVEVAPRQLELAELEVGDCRYPYGGELEGQAITFCGHPCHKGSSYCAPHLRLTRNPEIATERPGPAQLRLIGAGSGGNE